MTALAESGRAAQPNALPIELATRTGSSHRPARRSHQFSASAVRRTWVVRQIAAARPAGCRSAMVLISRPTTAERSPAGPVLPAGMPRSWR
jgi:hypothetical protein